MTRSARAQRALPLAVSLVTALAQPAAATPNSPDLRVWIDSWTASTVTVCAAGAIDQGIAPGGVWEFTISGARSDATLLSAGPLGGTGGTYPRTCRSFGTPGGTSGAFTASLAFVNGSVAAPASDDDGASDLAGLAVLTASWAPSTGQRHVSADTSD